MQFPVHLWSYFLKSLTNFIIEVIPSLLLLFIIVKTYYHILHYVVFRNKLKAFKNLNSCFHFLLKLSRGNYEFIIFNKMFVINE